MSEERLQKILARAGVTSRRKAEELIREGRVTVNGQVAEIGAKADLARDAVKLDGKRIERPAVHRYLLLNKPRGVMSTVVDPAGRPTVIELVPPGLRRALVPVGRLDFDTEGLLLLTDDGDFAQRIAHPRHGCFKTYEVKVKGTPEPRDIERLESGIALEGRKTAPCRIRPRFGDGRRAGASEEDGNSWWTVELGEGRTRQIREMFFRVGHRVQKLRRVGIGPLFDPYLAVGAIRELSAEEVARLDRAAGAPKPAGAAKKPRTRATGAKRATKPGETKTRTLAEVAREERQEAQRAARPVHALPVRRPVAPAARPPRAERSIEPAVRPAAPAPFGGPRPRSGRPAVAAAASPRSARPASSPRPRPAGRPAAGRPAGAGKPGRRPSPSGAPKAGRRSPRGKR